MIDPVVYAVYLYFLVARGMEDSGASLDERMKQMKALAMINNISSVPKYKARLEDMFERIGR